jgi:sugar phosphate isomerase/epimerase
MRFGICTSVENAAEAKRAGWDFVEELVQPALQGELPDEQWKGLARLTNSVLPVPAANSLLPATLKVVGPAADLGALEIYMQRVLFRAARAGIRTLVFGSGGARMVPAGFDHAVARKQILDFIRMSAAIAAKHDVLLVAEHLNRAECNIVNSVAEAMTYVHEVNHPNYQCLVDSYHFWLENEPLDSLRDAMPWIRHVHLADTKNRVAPGESGAHDYRSFFRVLKQGGYDRAMSIEPSNFTDIAGAGPRVLEFLKTQWKEA